MADTKLQVIIESQARLAGFQQAQAATQAFGTQTLATQRQITAQMQAQTRAQADLARQAQQSQGLFANLSTRFRSAIGLPTGGSGGAGGGMTMGGLLGAAGGWAGAAAGGMVAGAAYRVVETFRQIATTGLQLADVIGDLSDQLGVERTEALRLTEGANFSGFGGRVVVRGMGRFAQVKGLALSGDSEAAALLANFGLSATDLASENNNFKLARRIGLSLGKDGAMPQDDPALRRIFGERYPAFLTALAKMPATAGVSEEALRKADRIAASIEFADSRRRGRAADAVGSVANPEKWWAAASGLRYVGDAVIAYLRQGVATALTEAGRTAGFWTPPKLREQEEKTRTRMQQIEFNGPGASGAARRGLFTSAADYRLAMSQLSITKSMLKELEEIRNALTHGLKWEEA